MRLQGKVIIVTGSTTGIGKAIALRCVAEGAQVVVHGLEPEWGAAVVAKIDEGRAVLHIEDLTQAGAPQRLVDVALATFGRLDAVVNNAAWVTSSDIHTTSLDYLRKVIETNTVAPFALIQAALPHLQQKRGSVLNIGSINAYCGDPTLLAYSISKGALMTMTCNLGDALFRHYGVRVNQINPGWVLTESEQTRMRQETGSDDWHNQLPASYAPAGRLVLPDEMAAAAVYWLSDECGPISGQVVNLEQYPLIGRNPPKNAWA